MPVASRAPPVGESPTCQCTTKTGTPRQGPAQAVQVALPNTTNTQPHHAGTGNSAKYSLTRSCSGAAVFSRLAWAARKGQHTGAPMHRRLQTHIRTQVVNLKALASANTKLRVASDQGGRCQSLVQTSSPVAPVVSFGQIRSRRTLAEDTRWHCSGTATGIGVLLVRASGCHLSSLSLASYRGRNGILGQPRIHDIRDCFNSFLVEFKLVASVLVSY